MASQCQEGKQLKDKLKISVLDRAQNVLIVEKERMDTTPLDNEGMENFLEQ